MVPVAATASDPALDDGVRPPPPSIRQSPLTKEVPGSGIMRSMRAPLGSERQWRNVRLKTDLGADLVEDIDIAAKTPAFLCYPLLNIFAVSRHLHPLLNNPTKVYVGSISVGAHLRAICSVRYRTMIASQPTALLSASFKGCPPDDLISRGIVTIEQQAAEAPLSATNPVNKVFQSSALTPFQHAGVEGFISLGGTAVGASLGPNTEVLSDSGTQRVEDPNREVLIPINITIPIGAWHDMTDDGIRLLGRNLCFLFCSEACPDGLTLDCGILLSACYREE